MNKKYLLFFLIIISFFASSCIGRFPPDSVINAQNSEDSYYFVCWGVEYFENGGTGEVPVDDNYYLTDQTVTVLGNPNNIEKENCHFTGWLTESGEKYTTGQTFQIKEDTVMYASWTPVSDDAPCYQIKYDGNGSESGEVPDGSCWYPKDSKAVVLGNSGRLARSSYSFAGWNTSADGTGTPYSARSEIQLTDQDITLFAQWIEKESFHITYNGNQNTGGEAPVDDQSYYEGSYAIIMTNSTLLVRDGYVFDGWNTEPDGSGTDYNTGSSVTVAENLYLYAKWTPGFTIKYNGNGNDTGYGSIPIETWYKTGTSVQVRGNEGKIEKSGHIFGGWNTESDLTGTAYRAGNYITLTDSDINLYARWISTARIDSSFKSGTDSGSGNTGPDGDVNAVVIQPDGKILVAGDFNKFNGSTAHCLVRLNEDGTVDTEFKAVSKAEYAPEDTGEKSMATALALQDDGKILMAVTSYNITGTGEEEDFQIVNVYLIRLNSDGSLEKDEEENLIFQPLIFNNTINVLKLQGTEHGTDIFAGGYFTECSGNPAKYLIKITFDEETLTASVISPDAVPCSNVRLDDVDDVYINDIEFDSHGNIYAAGNFSGLKDSQGEIGTGYLARYSSSFTLDKYFRTSINNEVSAIIIKDTDELEIYAALYKYNEEDGSASGYLKKLKVTEEDTPFNVVKVEEDTSFNNKFNEEKADYIAMLDSNGVFDDTFSEVNKPDQPVTCLAVLSNQKAVLGGCFSSYNEAIHNRTVRIKTEDQ